MPFFVLRSFGISFTSYLRGVGRTTNIFTEVFFDFIAVSVMLARFFVQNIRLVLVFTAFFELSEFIYDSLDVNGTLLTNNFFSLDLI